MKNLFSNSFVIFLLNDSIKLIKLIIDNTIVVYIDHVISNTFVLYILISPLINIKHIRIYSIRQEKFLSILSLLVKYIFKYTNNVIRNIIGPTKNINQLTELVKYEIINNNSSRQNILINKAAFLFFKMIKV